MFQVVPAGGQRRHKTTSTSRRKNKIPVPRLSTSHVAIQRHRGVSISTSVRGASTASSTQINKKVQQSRQTSALAMHLLLARLVSMPVIFCLLPSSSIVILVFYLFSTDITEQHAWKLWVWIQSTGLTLPLWGTLVNNTITLILPVQWGTTFFCRWQSMRISVNFWTVFSES